MLLHVLSISPGLIIKILTLILNLSRYTSYWVPPAVALQTIHKISQKITATQARPSGFSKVQFGLANDACFWIWNKIMGAEFPLKILARKIFIIQIYQEGFFRQFRQPFMISVPVFSVVVWPKGREIIYSSLRRLILIDSKIFNIKIYFHNYPQ